MVGEEGHARPLDLLLLLVTRHPEQREWEETRSSKSWRHQVVLCLPTSCPSPQHAVLPTSGPAPGPEATDFESLSSVPLTV